MALTKRSTFGSLPSIFDDIFDRDSFDDGNYTHPGSTMPSVNIKESDETFIIELAAPGMKKDDFEIELNKNVLSISSEKEDEQVQEDDKARYTSREFSFHSFKRSFTLPKTVSADDIEARYVDGVLKITIPKLKETADRSKRKIDIR